ncbi:MAG: MBL fold metallo-hydrolase [Nitrospira sp.]
MPLEDELCDILKKSRMGQGLSVGDVARMTGLPGGDVTALERGDRPRDRAEVRALAQALSLRSGPLEQIALDGWTPAEQPPVPWVETIHGSIGGYGVHGYVVHDRGEAVLIDTAYNAPAMLEFLSARRLRLVGVCLTHGHNDHAEGIEQILAAHDAPVYLGPEDIDLLGWKPPADRLKVPAPGISIAVGNRFVQCLATPGHTPGGVCYRFDDQEAPLCFVGDTLFAGSIGRSNPFTLYPTHLASVRKTVLGLPSEYRLLPGHGPATTVDQERAHNPFFVPV